MEKIVIKGGKTLSGVIEINGAKNSAVALLPAAILSDEQTTISNVPGITDVEVLKEIINLLNGKITDNNGTIKIDSTKIINKTIPQDLSTKLRASYYFMGSLLAKFKHVEIYFPGGCNFGERQIDYHLNGFKSLGATVTLDNDKFIIDAPSLHGATINLEFPSCGATINIMLAATKAQGKTIIHNAAKEPEICNVAKLLINMGADINGAGTDTITINGVDYLHSAEINVIPDRIETGTYLIAGALLGDNLTIKNIVPDHINALLSTMQKMGITYELKANEITISKAKILKAVDIKTEVFPGFPTDLAQPICVLLSHAQGTSHIEETIYKQRMGHVKYLQKLGADITVKDNIETIKGPKEFIGTDVQASDLRAGATLFLAALTAKGTTSITNIEYILRGYDKFVSKLSNVGANIKIEEIK